MPKYLLQSVTGKTATVVATNEDTARIIAMKELHGGTMFTLSHPGPDGKCTSDAYVGLGLSLLKEEKENA